MKLNPRFHCLQMSDTPRTALDLKFLKTSAVSCAISPRAVDERRANDVTLWCISKSSAV